MFKVGDKVKLNPVYFEKSTIEFFGVGTVLRVSKGPGYCYVKVSSPVFPRGEEMSDKHFVPFRKRIIHNK